MKKSFKFLMAVLLLSFGFSACEQEEMFESPDIVGAQEPDEVPIETRTKASIADLIGVLDMPVNLIVKQNPYGRRYVTYKGINKACMLESASGGDDQKFFIRWAPEGTGHFCLIPFSCPSGKLARGCYFIYPNLLILFACSNPNPLSVRLLCRNWYISRGFSDNTSYVFGSDDQSLVLGVNMDNGNFNFSNYVQGKRTQEFEVRLCDEFEIVEMTLSNSGTSSIASIPDFVISESYSNNTSSQQTMTTKITKRAQRTSSFNRKTSISTQLSTKFKVDVKWLAGGEIGFTVGTNAEWSYGEQETIADDREYNFPLIVDPWKRIDVSIKVGRKKANIDYKAKLLGVNTGAFIWEEGRWENVDCTDIVVTLVEYDAATGQKTGRTRTINGVPTKPTSVEGRVTIGGDIASDIFDGSISVKP